MDQVHVEAPVASARAASVEREFYSDFPLVLNYVARLVDDVDGAIGITCTAFRQVAGSSRHRPTGDGLRRAEVFRAATELSRQALKPRRWFRRHRATLPSAPVGAAAMDQAFAVALPDRLRAEAGSRAFEIASAGATAPAPMPPELPAPMRPEVSSVPDLLIELEREIFRDEPGQDHPTPLTPIPESTHPMMAEPPVEEIDALAPQEDAEPQGEFISELPLMPAVPEVLPGPL